MGKMNNKVKNTILLVVTVIVVVAIQQAILNAVDDSIGTGNVQVVSQDSSGNEQWTMGLIPQLETITKADALADGRLIWASPGDYAGSSIMGITCAIAAVMWIVWMGIFIGFPGNVQLKKERIMGLLGIALLVLMLNLVFLRSIADATTAGSVVKNTAAHLSLAINNTGILMAIIFHRMGIGVKDPETPMMPALASSKCDKANSNFYKKFYGLMMILIVTAIIEIIFQFANAAIPEVAVDASVWLIWGVIFIAHFGTFPSDWKLGKRPKGIILMIIFTVLTVAVFFGLQIMTGEAIGSGVMESRLAASGLSENAGLSLMMSCWLVFWTIAMGAAGYCDPGACKPSDDKS